MTALPPNTYRLAQSQFNAIPGSPWVYWITPGLRRLFTGNPALGENVQVCIGMRTGDNFRFLRFWWELGVHQIGFNCEDARVAETLGNRWFPYMKGGSFQRWFGNQAYIVE